MGKVERRLTAAVMAIVFPIGLYVVVFAPFMVNERDDGSYSITDYSFTKGIKDAAELVKTHCAEQGLNVTGFDTKRTYNRGQNTFGKDYRFTCG